MGLGVVPVIPSRSGLSNEPDFIRSPRAPPTPDSEDRGLCIFQNSMETDITDSTGQITANRVTASVSQMHATDSSELLYRLHVAIA